MATLAVGDVQGCYLTLQRLLRRAGFRPQEDRLWLVGDLVNRGPRSLDVLRFAADLGDRAVVVLGNHDLKLVALDAGLVRLRPGDTLGPVLDAADGAALTRWLRERPVAHREAGWLMVHAGLLPRWDADSAESLARRIEDRLRGPAFADLLAATRAVGDDDCAPEASGVERPEVGLAVLTRLRTCRRASGLPCFEFAGEPQDAPAGCVPWFDVPGRRSHDARIVVGHWSALGLRVEDRLLALDTGCVWGRTLTAVRLEDRAVFSEPFAD
jgi:bis(5'-nucleosyl)-tetraphosphatase (symmetrical)